MHAIIYIYTHTHTHTHTCISLCVCVCFACNMYSTVVSNNFNFIIHNIPIHLVYGKCYFMVKICGSYGC